MLFYKKDSICYKRIVTVIYLSIISPLLLFDYTFRACIYIMYLRMYDMYVHITHEYVHIYETR